MRLFASIAAVLGVLAVAACGGGGGSGPTISDPPAPTERFLAFPYEGERQSVGVHQLHSPLDSLPVVGQRGDIEIRQGVLADGVGRDTVAAYLDDSQQGSAKRFTATPSLRVIGPSTERERRIVAEVVDAINLSLPAAFDMQIAEPDPDYSLRHTVSTGGYGFHWGGVPGDTIYVEFLPCVAYVKCGRALATTWAWLPNSTQYSYVQMSRGTSYYDNDRDAALLLAHELLHALGIDKHVDGFDSIMDHIFWSGPDSLLQAVDREALQALYTRLDPGDDPTDFGPWASTSMHIAGNGEHANFGVALRNGYAEPWAHGERPLWALQATLGLEGGVTWHGALVGFSGASAVTGDARITVDMGPLTGLASFTDLERASGVMWGDGDLRYTIAVNGNTFRETGGDEGRLTGIFTGAAHEGAAGTLERADLTAAFGAAR